MKRDLLGGQREGSRFGGGPGFEKAVNRKCPQEGRRVEAADSSTQAVRWWEGGALLNFGRRTPR